MEDFTKEKAYIVSGPEFGPLQGHVLIINKALHCLRTLGLCYNERIYDCLRNMGFEPYKV